MGGGEPFVHHLGGRNPNLRTHINTRHKPADTVACMPIDPHAVGVTTDPQVFEWTDRDTLLYALGVGAEGLVHQGLGFAVGVGAGTADLAFTTENSHEVEQQVLPTYAVIACSPFAAATTIGSFDFSRLLHGSQAIRVFSPLPPAGRLSVVSEVADIQDKGPGKNAVVMLKATGSDPDTGERVAESLMTLVIRGEGGFGGQPGQRPPAPEFPEREPDARLALPTREDQALIYRLSGDRNPLHSDPWFAQLAGFPTPILHGLCTYGVAGRALVAELCDGDATRIVAIAARFRVRARRCSAQKRLRPTGPTPASCSTTASPSSADARARHRIRRQGFCDPGHRFAGLVAFAKAGV